MVLFHHCSCQLLSSDKSDDQSLDLATPPSGPWQCDRRVVNDRTDVHKQRVTVNRNQTYLKTCWGTTSEGSENCQWPSPLQLWVIDTCKLSTSNREVSGISGQ